jgi:hypothetical protein
MRATTELVGSFLFAVLLVCHAAHAAIAEVDVTIKTVDVKARGISVVYKTTLGQKTIDLDVSRKAEITVNGVFHPRSDHQAELGGRATGW